MLGLGEDDVGRGARIKNARHKIYIPQTIRQAPTAVPHWRNEVGGFLNEMERLANGANLGKKTAAEWQAKIADMRMRLKQLLGEE